MHAVRGQPADPGQPVSCPRCVLECPDENDRGDQSCLNASTDLARRKNQDQ